MSASDAASCLVNVVLSVPGLDNICKTKDLNYKTILTNQLASFINQTGYDAGDILDKCQQNKDDEYIDYVAYELFCKITPSVCGTSVVPPGESCAAPPAAPARKKKGSMGVVVLCVFGFLLLAILFIALKRHRSNGY